MSFAPAGNDEWVQRADQPSDRHRRSAVGRQQRPRRIDARQQHVVARRIHERQRCRISTTASRSSSCSRERWTSACAGLPSGNIVEVDTPNLAFTVTRPGHYRIVVDPQDGATTVDRALGRRGEVYGENASYAVASGQAYRFYGNDLRDSELVSNTAARRVRSLGRGARPPLRPRRFGALRLAGGRRLRGSRHVRHVERRRRATATCGFPRAVARMGAVSRWALGVDRPVGLDVGRRRSRGASRRSTTAAGRISTVAGAGCRARATCVRSTRRRWSRSSAVRLQRFGFDRDRRSAGSRSGRAKSIGRRTASAATTSAQVNVSNTVINQTNITNVYNNYQHATRTSRR